MSEDRITRAWSISLFSIKLLQLGMGWIYSSKTAVSGCILNPPWPTVIDNHPKEIISSYVQFRQVITGPIYEYNIEIKRFLTQIKSGSVSFTPPNYHWNCCIKWLTWLPGQCLTQKLQIHLLYSWRTNKWRKICLLQKLVNMLHVFLSISVCKLVFVECESEICKKKNCCK